MLLNITGHENATMMEELNEALSVLKLKSFILKKDLIPYGEINTSKNTYTELVILYVVAKYCKENKYCLSESQIYDFLSYFNKFIESKNSYILFASEIIFSIYNDICNRYTSFSFELKSNLPFILYELAKIIDESFAKVSTFEIKKIYNKKIEYFEKASITNRSEKPSILPDFLTTNVDMRCEMIEDPVFIDNLKKITFRSDQDLKVLLLKLNINDLKRIYNLCINYDKLQEHEESINRKSFSYDLQKELGIILSKDQIQRAKISIRKTKIYIDFILDGKFIRHNTHGINHVKHNLEYGYQVLKLISGTKKDTM